MEKTEREIIVPIVEGGFDIDLPKIVEIRQRLSSDKSPTFQLRSMKNSTNRNQSPLSPVKVDHCGARIIAMAITKTCIDWLKKTVWSRLSFRHGQSRRYARGQLEVLAGYNVTEETMGVKIDASWTWLNWARLKAVLQCMSASRLMRRTAYGGSPHQTHTNFRGPIESGLMR